jgi:flagellar biosynthesis protein FlhF
MRLKRYRAETVREALALARLELGPSALVLSTRLVPARGPRGWLGSRVVEVTAAAERPEVSESRPSEEGDPDPGVGPRPDSVAATAGPQVDGLAARLAASGLDRAFALEVAGALPRFQRRVPSDQAVRRAVADRLQALVSGDEGFAPVEVFVGPPGVGKTTTIAKIAAQQRVRTGTRLTLVAADGYRVGAVEQLRLYAEIIGAPFIVVRTPSELERVIEEARGPLLVDTAGRSPGDGEAQALFDVFAGRPGVRVHLVVPAWTEGAAFERVLSRFEGARPGRVVFTRLDETGSAAPLVGLLRSGGLRASYFGTGQRVPEDLLRATPSVLASRVLDNAGDREEAAAC